jgi:hypothetical protein
MAILRRTRLGRFVLAEVEMEIVSFLEMNPMDGADWDCMCPLCYTPPAPDQVGEVPLRIALGDVARPRPA